MWKTWKTPIIAIGIILVVSSIPWIRNQPIFPLLLVLAILAFAVLTASSFAQTLSAAWKQIRQPADWARFNWRSASARNRLLGGAFVVVLILVVPHYMATTNGAYQPAVATAHQSPLLGKAMGEPVTEAWYSDGKVGWGNPATAELRIPVQGPTRSGNLWAKAFKNDGVWKLTELTLEFTQPGERIDLLNKKN
jgi:hypothetical protein